MRGRLRKTIANPEFKLGASNEKEMGIRKFVT
jgi:hypothetical protein